MRPAIPPNKEASTMRTLASRCLAAILLTVAWSTALPVTLAQDRPAALDALGIGLEGYSYPHPVAMLDVRMDGKLHKLAYMDVRPQGAPNGRTVLLLHGRNFPASYWAPTIEVLSSVGYRVIAPDQIHFGKSSKPDDLPVSFDVMAAHMDQLLSHLGLPTVSVDGSLPREDAAMKAEIEALARSILDRTDGRLQSLTGVTPLPFWTHQNGRPLIDSGGGSRALPDIALLQPGLTLSVPKAQAERVATMARQKASTSAWLPPNTALIDQAIARAFALWGIEASCLPDCGSATPAAPLQMTTEVNLSPLPVWALEYWVVPVARTP
jgi:pimeloyl-ACP methyl ester carboxylesterase